MPLLKLHIPDISCAHCIARITKTIEELGGHVTESDIESKIITVDIKSIQKDILLKELDEIGFIAIEV